jgi:hypothetical protein
MRLLASLSRFVLTLSFALFLPASALGQSAKKQEEKKQAEATAAPAPSQPPTNACGCYEDNAGQCHCVKKSKCGCPGTCEPAGCEDKRAKQLEKEAQLELKKQQEEDKKRNAELTKKQEEYEAKESQKRERGLRGLRLVEEPR